MKATQSKRPTVERDGNTTRWVWDGRIVELDGKTVRHLVYREHGTRKGWEDVTDWPFGGDCDTKGLARKLAKRECRIAGKLAEYQD